MLATGSVLREAVGARLREVAFVRCYQERGEVFRSVYLSWVDLCWRAKGTTWAQQHGRDAAPLVVPDEQRAEWDRSWPAALDEHEEWTRFRASE